MSFDPLYEIVSNKEKYVGMFKPPASLAKILNAPDNLLRDHFYLKSNNGIELNLVNQFFAQTVHKINAQGKNVIAVNFDSFTTGAFFKKKHFIMLIAIVPGKFNKEEGFPFDTRDGTGSSYLILAYEIDSKNVKLIEEKIKMYKGNNEYLGNLLTHILEHLVVMSSNGINFEIEEHFRPIDQYDIDTV
tara:strand:+ start:466 stop:1029 length:564 start_codon:yes stop_codon:yes gene_type:complete